MKPTRAVAAAVLLAPLLQMLTASAQTAAPPPPPPSGSVGSQSAMDFGSDGSGLGSGDDANDGSTWAPTPTATGAAGSWNYDWTWSPSHAPWASSSAPSSSSSSSSSSGSGWSDHDDEAGIEVSFPGLDGSIDAITRRTTRFQKYYGIKLDTTDVRTGVQPGNCPYAYCVHLVFESDYGAMTPFDAFILDRYETANPVGLRGDGWSWDYGGAMPLVLGRMSNETRARVQADADDVFNWNETRRTTWTLYPKSTYKYDYNKGYGYYTQSDELDITLSLKQLYTLLPGYTAHANNASDGPFYSADPTDQIVLRINAHVPSAFAGASAMLPIVVNHTGSQLVDINMTSTLLYSDGGNMYGSGGGNEIQLTFTLSRRKYGGALPWFPAKLSSDCDRCALETPLPETFNNCLEEQMNRSGAIMEDLLSPRNGRTWFDLKPFVQTCVAAIANGSLTNSSMTTTPMSYYDGQQWVTVSPPATEPTDNETRYELLGRVDKGLRCMTQSLCPIGGAELKGDAQVVVLRHNHGYSNMDLYQPVQHFYLQLRVEGLSTEPTIVTTQVMSVDWSSEQIAAAVANAVPDADRLQLDIRVYKDDNTWWIEYVKRQNAQRMEEYYRALQWSQGSQGSTSNSGSVGDGSAGDASSEGDGSAGSMKPQLPWLETVPEERYSIYMYSYNVTVSVHVIAVMTQEDARVYNYSYSSSLNFQVASLDLNKFEYVPPPPHVDLSWSPEPEWKTNVRRMLPTFASDDTCGKCTAAFEACLFDFDCAFGVNDYLRNALSRDRLAHKITTRESPGDPGVLYSVNITDALNNARAFFPAQGLATFEALGMCWMANECNFDYDRTIYFDKDNEYLPAKPTTLQAHGTEIQVVAELEETVTFYCDASGAYSFTIPKDVTADAIQQYLVDTVLQNQPASQRNVSVVITDQSWWRSTVSFSLRWPEGSVPGFKVSVQHWGSSATEKPLSVAITAYRRSVVDAYGGWTALQWPRLEQWLDLFRYVPASSYPGWNDHHNNGSNSSSGSNGTSNGNGTDSNPWMPPLPSSVVCWSCERQLQSCLSDVACATAARAWLPTVLPTDLTLHNYGFYTISTYWNVDALNANATTNATISDDHRQRILTLMACLTAHACPVGAGSSTSGSVNPTTVQLQATRRVRVVGGAKPVLAYKDAGELWLDPSADGLYEYLNRIQGMYGERIGVSGPSWDGDVAVFEFTGPLEAMEQLLITVYETPSHAAATTYNVWFESATPVSPTWEYLLMWFGAGPAPPSSSCPDCLPKLEACYGHSDCWRLVQESVLPILKQETNILAVYGAYNDTTGDYKYNVDVGVALRDRIVLANTPSFSTSTTWTLLTDVLSCFAAMACDVETMSVAMEPPATAHIPSFLKTTPASAQLLLYLDSTVQIDYNGRSVEYMEMAAGSVDALTSAFETVLEGSGIAFTVTLTSSDQEAQRVGYSVVFGDGYFGRLPQLSLVSHGHVTTSAPTYSEPFAYAISWTIFIESVNQYPQWDQLLAVLASPPTPTTSHDVAMFQCDAAVATRTACYASYDCFSLLARAMPQLQNELFKAEPSYDTMTQQFQIDLSELLIYQLFPTATQSAITTLMDMLRESALCATQTQPTATAKPAFTDVRLSFVRLATGTVNLFMGDGGIFNLMDEPNVDRNAAFQDWMYASILASNGANVNATTMYHAVHALDDGATQHALDFVSYYPTRPPHLSMYDTNNQFSYSEDRPWKLVFQSSVYSVSDAVAPWLAWLSMATA